MTVHASGPGSVIPITDYISQRMQPGDTLALAGGTYSQKIAVNVEGITIQPQENTGPILFTKPIHINAPNVTFDGGDPGSCTIQTTDPMADMILGYWSGRDASGSTVRNVGFEGDYRQDGGVLLYIGSGDYISVENCTFFESPGEDQVALVTKKHVIFTDCKFEGLHHPWDDENGIPIPNYDGNTGTHRDSVSIYPGTAPGYQVSFVRCVWDRNHTDNVTILGSKTYNCGAFHFDSCQWLNCRTAIKVDTSRMNSIEAMLVENCTFLQCAAKTNSSPKPDLHGRMTFRANALVGDKAWFSDGVILEDNTRYSEPEWEELFYPPVPEPEPDPPPDPPPEPEPLPEPEPEPAPITRTSLIVDLYSDGRMRWRAPDTTG